MNKNYELAIELLEKAKELFEDRCWDVMSEEWAWYLQVENLLRETEREQKMITKEIWEALDLICGFSVASLITEKGYEGGWYPDEIVALSEIPKVIRYGEEDYMQDLETSDDCERAVVTTQVLKKEFEDLGFEKYDYINMVILRT